jgi:ribonuclease HII
MAIYAGIDEAGYGPVLGPLCVACSAFEVPDGECVERMPNLWSRLTGAVCRKPGDKRRRIAIDDSKKLKGPRDGAGHPLRHLERAVLAFAALQEDPPPCDESLFARLGVDLPVAEDRPWVCGRQPLPLAHEGDEIRVAAASLRRVFTKTGIRPIALFCEAVDPAEFNQRLDCQNKADINFDAAMRRLRLIVSKCPAGELTVVIDRHGGRVHYLEPLQMCFPEGFIRIREESEIASAYEVALPQRRFTVRFEVDSEAAHLPVALASMTAKYVRDLCMERLNRYFQSHMPELKPTAGYYGDGQRFIREIAAVIERLAIDRDRLIRRA